MPRRSPRSRRNAATSPRLPGRNRPRATPGRRTKPARTARGAKSAHARKRRTAGPAQRPRRAPRPTRVAPPDPARVAAVLDGLQRLYPDAGTELQHRNALELLIATILSAQCTDERVNKTTPALFAKYPDAAAFAAAPQAELEAMVRPTGFFRMKARAIRECCADIVTRFHGEVPRTMEELTSLRGVGRKTANVVLGNAFGIPGLVVDTHVGRLSHRLGFTGERDAVKIEHALMPLIPRERWTVFSHWLILHGRRVCIARKPRCSTCGIAPHCPRLGVTASQ